MENFDMTKEIWKEIPQDIYYLGFKPIYEASNYGRIRNKNTDHILKYSLCNGNSKRLKIQLQGNYGERLSFLVSHIIYSTFIGDCYGRQVKFKDGDPHNYLVDNLTL